MHAYIFFLYKGGHAKYIACNLVSKKTLFGFFHITMHKHHNNLYTHQSVQNHFFPTVLMVSGMAKLFINCPDSYKRAL